MKEPYDIDNLMCTCDVAFYGYRSEVNIQGKTTGILRTYVKINPEGNHQLYQSYRDIYESRANVVFLDNEAVRNLIMGFPVHSSTVLVSVKWSRHVLYGMVGLVRRILQKHVSVRGWYKNPDSIGNTRWLILENHLPVLTKNSTIASPNSVDDVEKLIAYLNAEAVQYVILRNYEYLPESHREHGDVDFLVEDADVDKVRAYLLANPGHQSIGVHAVSVPRSKVESIPYLPPRKARQLIKERIAGRCNSWIPSPEGAFQSYAYHCVYNKGVASGVPTNHSDVPVSEVLENDYMANLKRLADVAGITDIEFTMEGLDEYLGTTGWRPHTDTLAKLAERNIWIKKHFFSKADSEQTASFVVMILRKQDLSEQDKQEIYSLIESYGFKIVFNEKLTGEKKKIAEDSLRGGVWLGRDEQKAHQYLPSDFLVVTDLYTLNKSKILFAHRVRLLKQRIRQQITQSQDGSSLLHSTDNTAEAIEYIKTVFPEYLDAITKEVKDLMSQHIKPSISVGDKIALYKHHLHDKLQLFKSEARVKIINFIFG